MAFAWHFRFGSMAAKPAVHSGKFHFHASALEPGVDFFGSLPPPDPKVLQEEGGAGGINLRPVTAPFAQTCDPFCAKIAQPLDYR
jgi:hypothetical protein